jgi:High potential iron-sulfur protein
MRILLSKLACLLDNKNNGDGMTTRNPDWSRRAAIQAVATGLSTALLSRHAQAQPAEKMTRAQAQYQDTPNGIYSCGNCSLFEKPKSCTVVDGDVSEDGWCKAFALVD